MANNDVSESDYLPSMFKRLYDKVESTKEKRTMVAIELGITHTKYTFKTEKIFLKESVDESLTYTPWHQGHNIVKDKVFQESTSIIMTGKKGYLAFGNKAEEILSKGKMEEDTNEKMYFHQFMKQIYHEKRSKIKDVYGKKADAVDVLGTFLRIMIDTILEKIISNSSSSIQKRTIRWAFTYPEGFNGAKMTIHESAQKAGIHYTHIYILPEAAAASLFCQNRLDSIYGTTSHMTTKTSSYLAVFLGEQTSYSILHKTLPNGQIAVINKAIEDVGNVTINKYFFDILSEILGSNRMDVLRRNKPYILFNLAKEFENVKGKFCNSEVNPTIRIAMNVQNSFLQTILDVCGEDLSSLIQNSKFNGQLLLNDTSLVIAHDLIESLYTKAWQQIEKLILRNLGTSTYVYLIGELSECKVIQNFVKGRFYDVTVMSPEGASLANLESAVIYSYQQTEQWFTAMFGCPVRECESHQTILRWVCMESDCRSTLSVSSWGNLKCENNLHRHDICLWKFQCGLHAKIGPYFDSIPAILQNSDIMYFKSKRVLACLTEKLYAQRIYMQQHPSDVRECLAIESGSINGAGEKYIPLILRCPVSDRDCPSKDQLTWICMEEDCNSPLQVSNWGNIKCQRKSTLGNYHRRPIKSWAFQCRSHGCLPANLELFDKYLLKSQENELRAARFEITHLKMKLQTQMKTTDSSHQIMLAVDNKWLNEEKWISLRMGCPIVDCENKEVMITWKCNTNGCKNPLYIGSKGNIKCMSKHQRVRHTEFITRWKFQCDSPCHKESELPSLNDFCKTFAKSEKEFDLSAIPPLSIEKFLASLEAKIQFYIEKQGLKDIAREMFLLAVDEDMLEAEEWVDFKSGCPVNECRRVGRELNWKCMSEEGKSPCRSQLSFSNHGNLRCGNSDVRKQHTGVLWHWDFYCDMHDGKPVDFDKLTDVLITSKMVETQAEKNSKFLSTLKSKISKEQQRQKVKQHRIGKKQKITLLAMNEESEKDYPHGWGHKRDPPPLFKDGQISDQASQTCDTVVVGAENIISRLILKDGTIPDVFNLTQNALEMKLEIQKHKKRRPESWNQKGHYEMLSYFSQMVALTEAIEKEDYMEMLRIFYQFQHKHVLRYSSKAEDIGIILDTNDVIIGIWKKAVENAVDSINEAAPGLYLFITDDKEKAKIEILESEDPNKCFTDMETEMAKIYLGHKWPTEQLDGTAIHEILHALGFMHEMQRYDAHLYLEVDKSDNNPHRDQCDMISYAMLTRFDPFSVMMYPEHEYLSRKGKDPIWKLKPDKSQRQTMSELDKVALNLVYPPCITPEYSPKISEENQMLYCNRNVMSRPHQASITYGDDKCGPDNWANCPACRVIKKIEKTKLEKVNTCRFKGKWQGMSGVFYCGKRHSRRNRALCGPDDGLPCTDCGKMLYKDYDYEKFMKSGICDIL